MSNLPFEDEDYTKQLDWSMWRKILKIALRQKRYLYPLAATAVLLAFNDVSFNLVTGAVIDEIQARGADTRIGMYAAMYGGLVIALVAMVWIFIYLAGKVSTGMSYDIRTQAFKKLQELPFSYYDKRPVGWLMTRMTSDCSKLSDIIAWGSLDLCWCVTMMVTIAGIMLAIDWRLALVALAAMPALLVVSAYFKKLILKGSRVVKKLNSQTTAAYNEGIMGVRTTKTMVRESKNLEEFQSLTGEMSQAAIRTALHSALYLPVILTLSSLGTGLVLWYGGVRMVSGTITLGTLVIFIAYTRQLFDPIQQMATVLTNLQAAQAAGERVLSLLEEIPEIKDSDEVLAAVAEHAQQGVRKGKAVDGQADRIKRIEFRGIDFAYGTGGKVLKDFNFTVEAGKTVALVGPTGGGKSTIVSLLCRFYEPTGGQILINGIDYRKRSLHWLQSSLGIVLQAPHLFNGSVMENIRYGKLSATDDEVIAAAKMVNADGFITALEKGYQTNVGEGGNKLSIGQKQLVSFARAILADPQIFVMDEATSSVDTQTEQLIQKGLETMLKGRISFVIAHRLSTIRNADTILVIEKGVITECGNHHELIRNRGHYYELYTNQFVHEKEEEILVEDPVK